MTRIVFAHGLESAPIGRKSQALLDAGYELDAPDCRGLDLAARVPLLVDALMRPTAAPLLVGSSYGGIAGLVAAVVATKRGRSLPGLVLCAPALGLPPPPDTIERLHRPAPTIIVHGVHDEIIPIDVSRAFAREHEATLHEVDDDHRLAGAGLAVILDAVRTLIGPRAATTRGD